GDTLALSAGERGGAFTDASLIPLRQGGNEVVGVGRARGGDHLFLRRIWPAEAEIIGDGAVEQCRVLGDDRDHPAHLIRVECTDVVSANADRAGLGVVLAQQQAEDGGFAGTARADNTNRLTGRNREAQPAMGVAAPVWIGEPDSLESYGRREILVVRRAAGRCVALCLQQRENGGGGPFAHA